MKAGLGSALGQGLNVVAFSIALVAGGGLGTEALSAAAGAWPPAVKAAPASTVALSPQQELATLTVAPGYSIQLAAAEPLIDNPIVLKWDFDGRLWVLETPTYIEEPSSASLHEPRSRISILEDTNDDGLMDKRTIFAENMILPRSMLILSPGKALIVEPPGVYLLEDTNGDLVSDSKKEMVLPFGAFKGDFEHTGNGLLWGLDNIIHNSEIGMAFRWRNGALQPVTDISRGQWGLAMDDYGRIYREGNSSAPQVAYVQNPYLARTREYTRRRGGDEWIGGPTREANLVWPIRPTPGLNRAYVTNFLRADGTLKEFTAAGGLALYRGAAMPGLKGDIFTPEPAANLISRFVVKDSGSGIFARKAYERGEFIASTDERFRPVWIEAGPDGALYVADMYSGIIQDTTQISKYLLGYITANGLDNQYGANGRIFRIVQNGVRTTPVRALSKATAPELVALLASPDGWYRDAAQRLLIVNNMRQAVPLLAQLAAGAPDPLTRIHALWTLDGLDAVTPAQAAAALGDPSRDVRVTGLRIAERFIGAPGPVTTAFLRVIGDTGNDWSVRYQLAASAGALGDPDRVRALTQIIDLYGADYIALDAALSGFRTGDSLAVVEALLAQHEDTISRRNALRSMSMGLLSSGTKADVSRLLARAAGTGVQAWQRDAILAGGEIVLLGNPDPGLPPPLPASGFGPQAVPGGLGDSAFPDRVAEVAAATRKYNAEFAAKYPPPPAPPSAMTSVAGVPTVVLDAAPAELVTLAAGQGAPASRAKGLLDFITWPGKEAAPS